MDGSQIGLLLLIGAGLFLIWGDLDEYKMRNHEDYPIKFTFLYKLRVIITIFLEISLIIVFFWREFK